MDIAYKVFIAVVAGCFAFFVMKKMTKWVFRIIVVGVIIALIFYTSISLDDVKGIFKKEPASEPVIEEAAEETPENITIKDNSTNPLAEKELQ